MNQTMLPRAIDIDLQAALENATLPELVVAAEEIGRTTIAKELKDERRRILNAMRGDVIEVVNRHRQRLGRRVCSGHDAGIVWEIYELLNSMAGPDGGADNDPAWKGEIA